MGSKYGKAGSKTTTEEVAELDEDLKSVLVAGDEELMRLKAEQSTWLQQMEMAGAHT